MSNLKIQRKKWEEGREIIELLIRSGLMGEGQIDRLEHVTEKMREIEDLLDNEPVTMRWSDEHDPEEEEEEGFFKKWLS